MSAWPPLFQTAAIPPGRITEIQTDPLPAGPSSDAESRKSRPPQDLVFSKFLHFSFLKPTSHARVLSRPLLEPRPCPSPPKSLQAERRPRRPNPRAASPRAARRRIEGFAFWSG